MEAARLGVRRSPELSFSRADDDVVWNVLVSRRGRFARAETLGEAVL